MAPPEANQISLDLLRTLVTFSEVGRVEETARHLKLTQAAVSLQLKKLEQELKVPLFQTVGRKKVLTDEARDLVQNISPLFRSFDEAFQKSLSKKSVERELTLRIGCQAQLMRRVLSLIQHSGPIKFFAMEPDQSLKALREDRVDLAVLGNEFEAGPFQVKKLFSSKLQLVVHKNLMKGLSGDWTSIQEQLPIWAFVGEEEESSRLEELASHTGMRSRDFQQKYVCEEARAALDMVSLFEGWTVLPSHEVEEREDLEIVDLPFLEEDSVFCALGPNLKGKKVLG